MKSLNIAIEEPPPQSSDGMNVERPALHDYDVFFEPFFNKLADHYNSKFQWFEDIIPEANKIGNFGFGKGGGETFALMWVLNAVEAVGFDNDPTKVEQANKNRERAQNFVEKSVPMVRRFYSSFYAKEFEAWYENKVSVEIRKKILPIFKSGDLAREIQWNSNYFDLGYSRYVLDKIEENYRLAAVSEMIRLIKPGGYLIIVAPEEAIPNNLSYLNIKLIKAVDKDKLGSIEWDENPPVGHIYLK